MCQPILNQRPKTHYKLQIRKFSSHTSLFRTLPEQLGTDDITHVSQPILYQRPKIQHKRLMTQFCKPILIQPPKIHLSKKINVHRIGVKNVEPCKKTRSNENLCATFRPEMVLSTLQWLKLPAPNPLQKCSQEVFPWIKGEFKIKILKYVKRDQKIKN